MNWRFGPHLRSKVCVPLDPSVECQRTTKRGASHRGASLLKTDQAYGHSIPLSSETSKENPFPLCSLSKKVKIVDHCSIGAQQGFWTGRGSINSTRVKFGSYKFSCHLPSRPISGFSGTLAPRASTVLYPAFTLGTPNAR